MKPPTRSLIAFLVAATTALPACGATGPDRPVSNEPGPSGGGGAAQPEVVAPRPGMVAARSIPWDSAEVGGDDQAVRVFFASGVEPCYVLDRLDVEYKADEVVLTLYEGTDPQARGEVCIEIAAFKAVDVRLAEPLAGRTLVDGSTG